jgi:hypothetical protein
MRTLTIEGVVIDPRTASEADLAVYWNAREVALDKIQKDYGGATMDGDPEWVEDMVEILTEDPHYLDD